MADAFNRPARKRMPAINVTPLIDVLFLLLIFFMVSSTFKEDERAIDITLPTAESATEQTLDMSEVLVDSSGVYYLNGEVLDEPGLRIALEELIREDPSATLVLRGDDAADFGRVVRAMDIAREVGVVNLVIPTDRIEEAPADR